jgi:outer membrane protein TolC
MKTLFFAFLLIINAKGWSQPGGIASRDSFSNTYNDSLIKQKLVELALANPSITAANAQLEAARYELKGAKMSWLNSVVLSGNINEFVINNTTINGQPASTLYPKYNVGVNLPLGLFSRQEKNISRERVNIYEAGRESQKREVIKAVLIAYENYKEKKELLELQKQITDGQYDTYQQTQKDFASGEIRDIGDVNKEFELWIEHRSKQRTRERDLEIAILELEAIIGIELSTAINSALNK